MGFVNDRPNYQIIDYERNIVFKPVSGVGSMPPNLNLFELEINGEVIQIQAMFSYKTEGEFYKYNWEIESFSGFRQRSKEDNRNICNLIKEALDVYGFLFQKKNVLETNVEPSSRLKDVM